MARRRSRKRHNSSGQQDRAVKRPAAAGLASASAMQKLRGYLSTAASTGSAMRREADLEDDDLLDEGEDANSEDGTEVVPEEGDGEEGEEGEGADGEEGGGEEGGGEEEEEEEGEEELESDGEEVGEESGGDKVKASAADWRSAAYSRHFDASWDEAKLDAAQASLRGSEAALRGVGRVEVTAPPDRPPVPEQPAGASDDEALAAAGVLPPLRRSYAAAVAEHGGKLAATGRSVLHAASSYRDVYLPCAAPASYGDEGGGLMRALALHTLQHVLVVTRQRLRAAQKGTSPADQGFTRPTVLVLLPFRSHALAFVKALLELLPDAIEQVENKARFLSDFAQREGEPPIPRAKPEDYRSMFEGNTDDCFRCGLRLSRKSAKLYAAFYKADLVVASPLGLRLGVGGAGEARADSDWLSSIEVLLLLHADVFLMQNWAHVARVLSLLNATPSETRDTDFSRVRPYALDGLSGRLRQTLLLAAHEAPELRALAMRSCRNASGRVAALPEHGVGCLSAVPSGTRQLFVRFDAASPAELADARLHAFKERLLPALLRAVGEPARPGGRRAQAVLFVPSYFDFVRVRQLLRDEDVPFVGLSEYSEPPDVARARAALQRGELEGLLVYTERAHFFRRHLLKGDAQLAFYGLPSYAHFYPELAQMLCAAPSDQPRGGGAAAGGTCVALFSKYDLQPLRRLVGDARAARMVADRETSFLFQ